MTWINWWQKQVWFNGNQFCHHKGDVILYNENIYLLSHEDARNYKKLRIPARKLGIKLKILRKRGLYFDLKKNTGFKEEFSAKVNYHGKAYFIFLKHYLSWNCTASSYIFLNQDANRLNISMQWTRQKRVCRLKLKLQFPISLS